jgi:hypothetical protein
MFSLEASWISVINFNVYHLSAFGSAHFWGGFLGIQVEKNLYVVLPFLKSASCPAMWHKSLHASAEFPQQPKWKTTPVAENAGKILNKRDLFSFSAYKSQKVLALVYTFSITDSCIQGVL